jgi:hypothetical protein
MEGTYEKKKSVTDQVINSMEEKLTYTEGILHAPL